MAAVISSLLLAKQWRKSTHSGGGACVEIARVKSALRREVVASAPVRRTASETDRPTGGLRA